MGPPPQMALQWPAKAAAREQLLQKFSACGRVIIQTDRAETMLDLPPEEWHGFLLHHAALPLAARKQLVTFWLSVVTQYTNQLYWKGTNTGKAVNRCIPDHCWWVHVGHFQRRSTSVLRTPQKQNEVQTVQRNNNSVQYPPASPHKMPISLISETGLVRCPLTGI